MDGYGIDNRCDSDIDGDGTYQPLGLIPVSWVSCVLPYSQMNQHILNSLRIPSCSLDSCPFDARATTLCFG